MTAVDKQKFSDHSKQLWINDREKMNDGRIKANATLRKNIAAGLTKIGTPETNEKISQSITQLYLTGGFVWSRGHHSSPKLSKEAYYRSSWELRHMLILDADPNVISYDYEPFSIGYIWEDAPHRYVPDFLVSFCNGHQELQEVGVGKLKEGIQRNLAKRDAAEKLCEKNGWTFKVITFG